MGSLRTPRSSVRPGPRTALRRPSADRLDGAHKCVMAALPARGVSLGGWAAISGGCVRRRPTLPPGPPGSTIGADRLSFRVRNGTGRFPVAMTAETLSSYQPSGSWLLPGNRTVDANSKQSFYTQWIVCVSYRLISTGQLHASLVGASTSGLSTQSSSWEPHTPEGVRRPHLEASFPLRCLQRLSLPNVANQRCPWQNNWHTRGSSVPVLSY